VTANIVLWLDLAESNQIEDAPVLEAVPFGATILRLTERGAVRCPNGTPTTPTGWRAVLDAIDGLVRDARKLEQQSGGCRFWVTGRAGLPAFIHLGHRLSKLSAITFIHQLRNSAVVTVMPLDGSSSTAEETSYFKRKPWPVRRTPSPDPVALVVSSVHDPDDRQIQEALAARKQTAAKIVRAHSSARIDQRTVAPAMREIDELIQGTCNAHAARAALAIFIAGPSSLAFLVGNAINPRACGNVQIFDFDGTRYSLVYELPYPPVPDQNKVLFFLASPAGAHKLPLDEEIRLLRLEPSLEEIKDRLWIQDIPAARRSDIFNALRLNTPGAVHFSGHGNTGVLFFQDDLGNASPLAMSDLAETLRLAGSSVRLVVLSACHSESQAEALLAYADCVVTMRGSIVDADARRFAVTFYRHLAEGDSVQDAFDKGRLDVRLNRPAVRPEASPPDATAQQPAPPAREEPLQLLDPEGRARTLFLVRRR